MTDGLRHVVSPGARAAHLKDPVCIRWQIQCALSDGGRYRSGDLSCGPALTDEAF
jgi:hypothetical protein